LIAVSHPALSAGEIESRLRAGDPPVIARLQDDRVLIDLRTVADGDEPLLVAALRHAAAV
jgi:L-seryl-tRNA(Ser) seleniumtransferase